MLPPEENAIGWATEIQTNRYVLPPHESEIIWSAEVERTSRKMRQTIVVRWDYDPDKVPCFAERYAPLKYVLNDALVRELLASGELDAAVALRDRQGLAYFRLLKCLARDCKLERKQRLRDLEAIGGWYAYGEVFRFIWLTRKLLLLFQFAGVLYIVRLPGWQLVTRKACQQLARCFPAVPQNVVPIRP